MLDEVVEAGLVGGRWPQGDQKLCWQQVYAIMGERQSLKKYTSSQTGEFDGNIFDFPQLGAMEE